MQSSDDQNELYILRLYLRLTVDEKSAKTLVKTLLTDSIELVDSWLIENPQAEIAIEIHVLQSYLEILERESELGSAIKTAEAELDEKAYAKYPQLSMVEIKVLAVEDKWLPALYSAIHGEMDRISQALTQRVKELTDRYDTPMPQMVSRVTELEARVNQHLEKMGFLWK